MTALDSWRVLTDDKSGDIVLAVDFDATGRPEARFTDLVTAMGPGITVWETVPQSMGGADVGLTGEGYIGRWAEEVRASGRQVSAVMGFCVGSVYAAPLAERIGQWQREAPRMILFDPEQASPLSMYWQFLKVIELMSSVLSPAEAAEAREAGRLAQQENENDLPRLGAELLKQFQESGGLAFDRLGLDAERRAEVSVTFGSFISYLSAAGQLDPFADWRKAIAISSASPTSGLNAARAAAPGGEVDMVAQELRFGAQHTELLRDPEVARAVADLIRSRA
ncbi:hypothetical protein ACFY4K_33050 [Streptomyces leeuwenhoekii]|uniref:hypothetical protein n=1 Tax=Streptomyces leeuwenhoekii TaxID=1437453 RepID=UPI00368A0EF9